MQMGTYPMLFTGLTAHDADTLRLFVMEFVDDFYTVAFVAQITPYGIDLGVIIEADRAPWFLLMSCAAIFADKIDLEVSAM